MVKLKIAFENFRSVYTNHFCFLGSHVLKTETTLVVDIIDENDEVPTFTQQEFRTSVMENNSTNLTIIALSAQDRYVLYQLRYGKFCNQAWYNTPCCLVAVTHGQGILKPESCSCYMQVCNLKYYTACSNTAYALQITDYYHLFLCRLFIAIAAGVHLAD